MLMSNKLYLNLKILIIIHNIIMLLYFKKWKIKNLLFNT
jgi:hypothetical protein